MYKRTCFTLDTYAKVVYQCQTVSKINVSGCLRISEMFLDISQFMIAPLVQTNAHVTAIGEK